MMDERDENPVAEENRPDEIATNTQQQRQQDTESLTPQQERDQRQIFRGIHDVFGVHAVRPRTTLVPSTGAIRYFRNTPPADYMFKIDSFSLLSTIVSEEKATTGSYQSHRFQTGGYKWRLSLYPNGDAQRNGLGYVSLYLLLEDASSFPLGFDVNVNYNLFVYNYDRDNYLTVAEAQGKVSRFNKSTVQHGFPQFISHDAFYNATNGYLTNDTCVFGVEVFVIRNKNKGEHLSLLKEPQSNQLIYTWKIDNFSKIKKTIYSDEILVGERSWKLKLERLAEEEGRKIRLHLNLNDRLKFPNYIFGYRNYIMQWLMLRGNEERKVYVGCVLRIKNQLDGDDIEEHVNQWYTPTEISHLFPKMLNNDFLVGDTLIIEVGFKTVISSKNL